jgi:hypothetical protein
VVFAGGVPVFAAAVALAEEFVGAAVFTVTGPVCALAGALLLAFAAALPFGFAVVGPLCTVTVGLVAAAGLPAAGDPWLVPALVVVPLLAAVVEGLEVLLPPFAAVAGVADGLGLAVLFWLVALEFCAVAIVAMAVASARI